MNFGLILVILFIVVLIIVIVIKPKFMNQATSNENCPKGYICCSCNHEIPICMPGDKCGWNCIPASGGACKGNNQAASNGSICGGKNNIYGSCPNGQECCGCWGPAQPRIPRYSCVNVGTCDYTNPDGGGCATC